MAEILKTQREGHKKQRTVIKKMHQNMKRTTTELRKLKRQTKHNMVHHFRTNECKLSEK